LVCLGNQHVVALCRFMDVNAECLLHIVLCLLVFAWRQHISEGFGVSGSWLQYTA
jgi:hypothetical protein